MKNTALLVIDMQTGFIEPASAQCIAGAKATIPACVEVINHFRREKAPVIFVTRRYRADGSDVEHTRYASWLSGGRAMSPGCPDIIGEAMPEEFCVSDSDISIIKPRFSAFFQTELDLLLRRLGIETLVLAGTTTPNCIRCTCYDGIALDYNIAVLSDCTSSVTEEIQRANLLDMKNIGAQIISSAELIGGAALTATAQEVRRAMK